MKLTMLLILRYHFPTPVLLTVPGAHIANSTLINGKGRFGGDVGLSSFIERKGCSQHFGSLHPNLL